MKKMKIQFVDLHSQYLSIKHEIDNAIENVITDTAFIGGKYVKKFKEDFQNIYGVKHCIPVANGTDAIYIILKMLGIGSCDEVITTASTWISTSETITQVGATPVFVDIENEYYTIDTKKIEVKITPATKAIIPVHLYGQMADLPALENLCKKYNLFLIEDCAQSHFSEYKGVKAGLTGIASSFSFYPGKNLGAYGDAGCIITNDDMLAEKIAMFANHGALVKHQHVMEGINSRLDGLQAAILTQKLNYIKSWTALRIKHATLYSKLLENVGDIKTPSIRENSIHSFHLYVIRTSMRDTLMHFLSEQGIETAVHYPTPVPLLEAYKRFNFKEEDFPMAKEHSREILSLPMYPELTDEKITYVVDCIKKFYASLGS